MSTSVLGKRTRGDEPEIQKVSDDEPEIKRVCEGEVCCVCSDETESIISMICGHKICDACNTKYCLANMERKIEDITCPMCRTPFTDWTMQSIVFTNDRAKDTLRVISIPHERRLDAIKDFIAHYTEEKFKISILKSFVHRGLLAETKFIIRSIATSVKCSTKAYDRISTFEKIEGIEEEKIAECLKHVAQYFPSIRK